MIKNNYKVIVQEYYYSRDGFLRERWDWRNLGRYDMVFSGYCRNIQTFNECRANAHAIEDGYKVRGRRRPGTLPSVNDDKNVGRNWKRSWKDFTKCRKQYMKNL